MNGRDTEMRRTQSRHDDRPTRVDARAQPNRLLPRSERRGDEGAQVATRRLAASTISVLGLMTACTTSVSAPTRGAPPASGVVYFAANDGTHGTELWRSDGTGPRTAMVRDIWPGSHGSAPSSLMDVNGTLYFVANDGVHGRELWKSDGTATGSVMVKDIASGPGGSGPEGLTDVGGVLFFVAEHGHPGVWRSDGTASGTIRLRKLPTYWLNNLTAVGDRLFFALRADPVGDQLWRSDGTVAGTAMVEAIRPKPTCEPDELTAFLHRLYFNAGEATHGEELWSSNGTAAGTRLVKDTWPGPNRFPDFDEGCQYGPRDLSAVGRTLFFSSDDGKHGTELWRSDGTGSGTEMVKDINRVVSDRATDSSYPTKLTDVQGTLVFAANDPTHGYELWRSDGRRAGTTLVKDIAPGTASSLPNESFPSEALAVGPNMFFPADDASHGSELWKSDGTEQGTVLVKDINPSGASSPTRLMDLGGSVLFFADDGTHGAELWKSDGTQAGTVLVKDINPGAAGSSPSRT